MSGPHLRRATGALALVLGAISVATFVAAPSATAVTCTPRTTTPTVTVDTASPVLGGPLELSGTGWCHPTDGGSRIAVKIDAGAYSRPDTSVHTNTSIWAVIDADASDGSFTATVELPDGTAATSSPRLTTGTHTVQLLTGSLKSGDTVRSVASAAFVVAAPDDPDPPAWSHATVSAGGATAWVADQVPAGDGHELRIAGFGWTRTGGRPSAIAVKLGSDPRGGQYERSGTAVLHGDPTIWAMLTPGPDGTLDTTIDLPDDLVAGQYLTVALLTGKFANGDVQRAATTEPLTVGGTPWEDDGEDPGTTTCTPTSTTPTVRLTSTRTTFGGVLHLEGAGWCHPTDGGSRIAVKIDDGAYSHLSSDLSSNRTIWAIVDARDSDGTFSADITLPDGTTATSAPALPRGEHTLRLLTGSLIPGDAPRTLESESFVVGGYRPNGTPDPIDAGRQLRPGTRHEVRATVSPHHLRVALPQADVGTWAFVSLYAADGSPRYPWSRWSRVDAHHRIVLPLTDGRRAALAGRLRVVVQDGDPGRVGRLLGWTAAQFGRSTGPAAPLPITTPPPTTTTPTTAAVVAPPAAPPAPLVQPAPPVASYADLDPDRHGSVRGVTDAGVVTVTVRGTTSGDSVFVHVYTPTEVLPAGWMTVGPDHRLSVDLTAIGGGYAAVTVQDATGRSLGWAPVSLGAGTTASDEPPVEVAPAEQGVLTTVASGSDRTWIGTADGLLLALGALVLAAVSFLLGLRRPGATA